MANYFRELSLIQTFPLMPKKTANLGPNLSTYLNINFEFGGCLGNSIALQYDI